MAAQTQLPVGDMPEGEVCIANISPAQRMRRLRFGVISLVITLAILGGLVVLGASRWWRLALVLPLAAAATGYFQWHDKTCVRLAADNARFTGDHEEKIEDASELAQIRRQASRVQLKSAVAALALTLVTLAIPGVW